MAYDEDGIGAAIIVTFLVMAAAASLAMCSCYNDGIKHTKTDAVKHGAGRWVPLVDGTTNFEWITPEKK